ncbi:MAG: hypothetical protein BWY96_02874 [Spirochaetes bacterium ADurb.BinA120]|nr:MAG: hypothetical protein BWY96_02874 [Spirochaetes bacterium ADurb.BinA120]
MTFLPVLKRTGVINKSAAKILTVLNDEAGHSEAIARNAIDTIELLRRRLIGEM